LVIRFVALIVRMRFVKKNRRQNYTFANVYGCSKRHIRTTKMAAHRLRRLFVLIAKTSEPSEMLLEQGYQHAAVRSVALFWKIPFETL